MSEYLKVDVCTQRRPYEAEDLYGINKTDSSGYVHTLWLSKAELAKIGEGIASALAYDWRREAWDMSEEFLERDAEIRKELGV